MTWDNLSNEVVVFNPGLDRTQPDPHPGRLSPEPIATGREQPLNADAAHTTALEQPREVELKLELEPQDAARLGETSLVRGNQGHPEALCTIYFDSS